MNQSWRTFFITVIVIIGLIFLGYLPEIVVGGHPFRNVDLFSDLVNFVPSVDEEDEEGEADEKATEKEDEKKDASEDGDAKADEKNEGKKYVAFADDKGERFLDFSDEDHTSMDVFYDKLRALQKDKSKTVRIAYYGDSFIEGDILSADVRDMLQERFGGGGFGMYDVASNLENARGTILQQSTGFTISSCTKDNYQAEHSSINLHYCVPQGPNAQVVFKKTDFTRAFRKHNSKINKATLYFSSEVPATITAMADANTIQQFHFEGSSEVQAAEVECPEFKDFTWKVATGGEQRTWAYSAAFDTKEGISLDNISMRGSDGLAISQINDAHMAQMAKMRPYDLILMGFGLNFASESGASKNYQSYQTAMKQVVAKLRKHYPEAPIVIVSVSDRCQRNSSGQIATMPCIKKLVEVQYKIAKDNKVAFWNLFEGMGGENSMRQMADNTSGKRLANKDYTHITYDGGKIIAEKMVEAMMKGL